MYHDFTNSITRQINKTRRNITILFTDIQDSTRYWEQHGDVQGRLMIDQHNRLVFPVIKKFRGKIIKTMGDAVMASFKKPEDALKAAIGIQQILKEARSQNQGFQMEVRVGVHTGMAIVEERDVFGDVVNVAARVEAHGKGGEILISTSTAEAVDLEHYYLQGRGEFSPKGKSGAVTLFSCDWQQYPQDLTAKVRFKSWLPLLARQRRELLLSLFVTIGISYFLYTHYIRYVFADFESVALLFVNPFLFLGSYSGVIWAGAAIFITLFVWLFFKVRAIPYSAMHLLKGGFGFAIGFMLLFLPAHNLEVDWGEKWNGVLHESKHLFVKVLRDNVPVYEESTVTSPILISADKRDLLLLADVTDRFGFTWNKVLVARSEYGWVQRVTPPRLGVPSQRVTKANKFYFKYKDLYALLLGALGFLWGIFEFRIKPA